MLKFVQHSLLQHAVDLLCHILRRIEKQFNSILSERKLRKVSDQYASLNVVLLTL